MSQNNAIYGGQAVIEGVMFAGKTVNVTAVRAKDGSIQYLEVPKQEVKWVNALKKIPLLRGIVALVESAAKGAQHLNFAAETYADEDEKQKQEKEKPGVVSNIAMILGVAVIGVLTFLFGKFVLTLVPTAIEQLLFAKLFDNQIGHNLIEGLIKIILLVGYLYFISLTPMIKRLFQYHGAEHKVISAYEAGLDLTVQNVQKFSTLHYRCGSSFMVFTVIIGVIIYSFFPYDGIWERMLQRIILLPVVIGVSYEVLRITNSFREIPVLRFLGYPGLWLQKLTTKEPADDMVEVSIASFNRMREIDVRLSKPSEV
ncbi:DUF1385 domain-containing protein [Paenibacillus albiflavus]|uniref:DUF1385 domain-containing protein n=1 Tax=Paenibacillus albiflavus TaxID=2545760 RepID=A0A4R4EBY6_9BACL|nr:DUF1385 domain-containing protein [Paenibacillus albiflavus]TCZ77436.1 DUF1385 domain-containing protein [Paenibacillus albiflavus]